MSQGTEGQDGGDGRLPVVARWGELVEDRRRQEVQGTGRSPIERLITSLRSGPTIRRRGKDWLGRRALGLRRRAARRDLRSAPRPSGEDWLVPILVDCFGRDGSTLMMRLLASSPQIALGTRYPHEDHYFTYLWRWSRLLERTDWPRDVWGPNEVCSVSQEASLPLLGPPPWTPRDLIEEPGDGRAMSRRCFELAWQEFSRRARERTRLDHPGNGAAARYYAEKHLDSWNLNLDELPPLRMLVLLRDPRDVWVSVQGFERKRPRGANFRSGGALSRTELLRYQIARQRVRLRWIAELLESDRFPVIRYEELVLDLPGVAKRLELWLGVTLDAGRAGARDRVQKRHASSDSPEDSISRWRRELDPTEAELFAAEIGPELRMLGFEG